MLNLFRIPPNDVDTAVRYYEERGQITYEEFRTLLSLQTEETTLGVLLARSENWKVTHSER